MSRITEAAAVLGITDSALRRRLKKMTWEEATSFGPTPHRKRNPHPEGWMQHFKLPGSRGQPKRRKR